MLAFNPLKKFIVASSFILCGSLNAQPSAYIPLHLDAHLEQQLDRLFALTEGTPMSKPYSVAQVKSALTRLKSQDPHLHDSISNQLKRYLIHDGVSRVGVKITAKSGEQTPIPNQRGIQSNEWGQGFFEGIYRPNSYTLLQLGMSYNAHSNKLVNYNSFVSLAAGPLQLGLGYKEHWFSPFKNSSQLISSNAATSPSVSLGLSQPLINLWGLDFELYYSELERVKEGIRFKNKFHDGRPKLAGTHISIEPIEGWKIGFNRLMHFGGGPRETDIKDVVKAFFDPAGNDNSDNVEGGNDAELGDQLASFTTAFNFDFGIPTELYFEYGGEDTSGQTSFGNGINVFGNQVFGSGVYLPHLLNDWSMRYEYTSWHEAWYVNGIYKFGNTNKGAIYGHFAAEQRVFGNAVAADTHVLQLGYHEDINSTWQLKLTVINNENSSVQYKTATELNLLNSRLWQDYRIESQLSVGKDVFDENYAYLSMAWFW